MASISGSDAAAELLRQCTSGLPWSRELATELARPECSDALFHILVEGLADRFERRLCDEYADIFAFVLERALPQFHAADVVERYQEIREPRRVTFEPRRVAVLSRVTLGADIAITSALLGTVRRRFPRAEIYLAGSVKAAELFAGFEWLRHFDVPYVRGSIPQRLEAWNKLAGEFRQGDWLVVDPDSRLTQLGLLPLADPQRYCFFESRAYGEDTQESLTELCRQWAQFTFGVASAPNQIAPRQHQAPVPGAYATVSLGTADNASKQMPAEFEARLIREITAYYPSVIVDRGVGPQEAERVERAIEGTPASPWSGSFAAFTSLIGGSACYIGYDSAGQHAAAALGTPLITLFKGFVNPRMFARWQPTGPGPKRVIPVEGNDLDWRALSAAMSSFSRL